MEFPKPQLFLSSRQDAELNQYRDWTPEEVGDHLRIYAVGSAIELGGYSETGLYCRRIPLAAICVKRPDSWTLKYPVALQGPFEQEILVDVGLLEIPATVGENQRTKRDR